MNAPLPDPRVPVVDSADLKHRYHEILSPLREQAGIAWDGQAYLLLRYADVYRALREEKYFSKSKIFAPATFPFMGPNIQGYDGAEHTLKRSLVTPAFRKKVIPTYVEPILRPIAEDLLDELLPRGEMDLMHDFARKYPMRVTCRLLGIPAEDEDRMAAWAVDMLSLDTNPEGGRKAYAEFTEYVLPLVEQRRRQPGDDLLSALVTERVEGQQLDEEEILSFLRLLFPAGVDTTWQALGSLMYAVLQQPATWPRLLASEEDRYWAVEETLRWESAVGIEPRITVAEVELCGIRIPADTVLKLALPTANRDPAVFSDPDAWRLDRKPAEQIAFGLGRHLCLGAFLARGELQVALEVLLRRLPNPRLLEEANVTGVVIRGPDSLKIAWDTAGRSA